MKNKAILAAQSSLIMGALLISGTAFAATSTTVSANAHGQWGQRGGVMPGVFGTVSAISGDIVTVVSKIPQMGQKNATPSSTTYSVDATNAVVLKNNATSTLSSIAVNDMVMVQGAVNGTSVVATKIRDGMGDMMKGGFKKGAPGAHATSTPIIQGNGEPVIGGNVTAVSGSSLTVTNKSNVTYSVDATNATVQKGNAASTVGAIAVGDAVVVQGTVNGTAVVASSVVDQAPRPASTSGSTAHAGLGGFIGSVGGFFQHIFGFF